MATTRKTSDKKEMTIRNPEKYEYAFLLFMQKMAQKDICAKVDITPATMIKWKESGGWEEKRAVRSISVDTLITKTLQKINDLLDNEDFNADSFSKAVNQLKNLKQGASIDDKILALMNFGDWLIEEMTGDKEITEAFIKQVTAYQDKYILKQLRNGNQQ